jgi:nitrogen fixation/metabolism regulation signal transduction histidine kinase
MTLRTKFTFYLIALHVVLAAAAFWVLVQNRPLLFLVEGLFVLLVIGGISLVRRLLVPLDLIHTGAELINERDFSSRFVPIGEAEMDTLIGVYNKMLDTLREERLAAEEQHQLLQKIVAASPAAIVICDFDGNVQQANPAAEELLGCHPERSEGPGRVGRETRATQPHPPGSLAHARDDIWPQLADIPVGKSKLIAHHGMRRLKATRAEFRDRGFAKSFFVIEELTEELWLSEKAAYEKLVRMMSHEVNNSVGAVRSLLESSLHYAPQVGDADRDDFTSALTIASARIDALNRFMAAFADVVRIPPPKRAPVRVDQLVARVAALLRSEHAIALDLDDPREYDVDAGQIEQVVLNIFRNAIDATGPAGEIRASMRNGELVIADSGPGISESIRSDLFTPFFTTKRDGRGLGLTIVQEILANHALPFELRNREGGGAEFVVWFGG